MPVPKIPLGDALAQLRALGKVVITVSSAAALAQLEGALQYDLQGGDLLLQVGCACRIRIPRDRVRHAVISEKELDGKPAGHVQFFDDRYEKLVAFAFPEGLTGIRALITSLDGNDFEIA